MKKKDIKIGNASFTLTELENRGYYIGIRPWKKPLDGQHFIFKTVNSTFNKELFGIAHTPIVIDTVDYRAKFSRRASLRIDSDIRVLDCPIKFPDSLEYRVPNELTQFEEVIAKIVSYEHSLNPYVRDYYAYLTVDQGYVYSDSYQRVPGCHVDGFQGARIKEKRPISRSYIAYDCLPPFFYPQSFKTDHLDEAVDDFFFAFDEQADPTMECFYDPYSIVLMNAYTVHRGAQNRNSFPIYRTFLRLIYDVTVFDRYGNTHNPLFKYNWPMITRDTRSHLRQRPLHNVNAY